MASTATIQKARDLFIEQQRGECVGVIDRVARARAAKLTEAEESRARARNMLKTADFHLRDAEILLRASARYAEAAARTVKGQQETLQILPVDSSEQSPELLLQRQIVMSIEIVTSAREELSRRLGARKYPDVGKSRLEVEQVRTDA